MLAVLSQLQILYYRQARLNEDISIAYLHHHPRIIQNFLNVASTLLQK